MTPYIPTEDELLARQQIEVETAEMQKRLTERSEAAKAELGLLHGNLFLEGYEKGFADGAKHTRDVLTQFAEIHSKPRGSTGSNSKTVFNKQIEIPETG